MSTRQLTEVNFTIIKRMVHVFGAFTMSGTTPVLQKWVYQQMGAGAAGSTVRVYTNAPAAATLASGRGPWPQQYVGGAEGIRSVTRTGTGLWTIQFQDAYQRCIGVQVNQLLAGGLGNIVGIGINSTLTNMDAAGGSTLAISTLTSAATAGDPTASSTVLLGFIFADATEP